MKELLLIFLIYRRANSFRAFDRPSKYVPYFWTPERGYKGNNDLNLVPRRIPGFGSHMGLTVVLYANREEYYCSSSNSLGFKVLIHNPVETPKISNFGYYISPGGEGM